MLVCLFRIMEVLLANAREHLLKLVLSQDLSLLHLAAVDNHTRVCSLLATEVNMLSGFYSGHVSSCLLLHMLSCKLYIGTCGYQC